MKPWVGGDDFSMIDPARVARHNDVNVVTFSIEGKHFISRMFHHLDSAFDFAEALTNNLQQAGVDLSQTEGYVESLWFENGQVLNDTAGDWCPEYNMWGD